MTLVTKTETGDAEGSERLRPKVGRIPVTLKLLNENAEEHAHAAWGEDSLRSRKSDTQFMLLLVTLFIIVNLTLVTLLNHKDRVASTAKSEIAIPHETVKPVAAATVTLPPAPPTAAVIAPAAVATPAAPLPVSVISPSLDHAYVTPASPGSSKEVAAPMQRVTVTPQPVMQTPPTETLTVIHTPQAPSADNPSVLAPAAGNAAATAPTTPPQTGNSQQDLLSVITKD